MPIKETAKHKWSCVFFLSQSSVFLRSLMPNSLYMAAFGHVHWLHSIFIMQHCLGLSHAHAASHAHCKILIGCFYLWTGETTLLFSRIGDSILFRSMWFIIHPFSSSCEFYEICVFFFKSFHFSRLCVFRFFHERLPELIFLERIFAHDF